MVLDWKYSTFIFFCSHKTKYIHNKFIMKNFKNVIGFTAFIFFFFFLAAKSRNCLIYSIWTMLHSSSFPSKSELNLMPWLTCYVPGSASLSITTSLSLVIIPSPHPKLPIILSSTMIWYPGSSFSQEGQFLTSSSPPLMNLGPQTIFF